MSINDLADELQSAAREALLQAKALEPCRFHTDVLVRTGDSDAERHAYALATNALKRSDRTFLREDLMEAIKDELEMAADDECPQCAYLADQ